MACPPNAGGAVTGKVADVAAVLLLSVDEQIPEVPVLETPKGCIFASAAIARCT